jgi:hypothetical protein
MFFPRPQRQDILIAIFTLLTLNVLNHPSSLASSSAFATTSSPSLLQNQRFHPGKVSRTNPVDLRQPVSKTPSTTTSTTTNAMASITSTTSLPPKTRVRITALDGIRGLLACHIVLGHFLRYANPPGRYKERYRCVSDTCPFLEQLTCYNLLPISYTRHRCFASLLCPDQRHGWRFLCP